MEGTTFAPPPQRFEAGVPNDRAGGRARCRRRLPRPPSAWTPSRRTSTRSPATRSSALARSPACASSGRRTTEARGGAVSFVVDGIHPHDVGQVLDDRGRRGPGRPPLRLAAACGATTCRPPRARRSTSTTTEADVDALVDGGRARADVLRGRRDAARADVPGDHPRPLPAPAAPRPARAVRRRGPPRQPDLRRRGHRARALDGRRRSTTSPTTARAARSARPATSVMTELVIGRHVDEALAVQEEFLALMQSRGRSSPTRTCSRTPSRSRASRSSRRGSSARCSGGWH